MGKIYEKVINDFSFGMTNDPREKDSRYSQLIKNFDAYTYKHKLVPYRDSANGDSASATTHKVNFLIALGAASTYYLFGLGRTVAAEKPEVYVKTLSTSDAGGLAGATWASLTHGASALASPNWNLFVYYSKTGLIYGAAANKIWACDPTDVAAFDDDKTSTDGAGSGLAYTNMGQGLVHSKDNVLYIPYDNKIASVNNTTWNKTALTLPTHLFITSICEYGNYLAIACAPLAGIGNSVVFLWDRDSSLATLSENINWGEGNLRILEELNGYLIGISYLGITNILPKVILKKYREGSLESFKEVVLDTSVFASLANGHIPIVKQKYNNKLYFLMDMAISGVRHQGLWTIGMSDSGVMSLVHDMPANNDTALSSGTLQGFICVGDYKFIAYVSSGAYAVAKIYDTSSFTLTTSIYESLIQDGNANKTKKLLSAGIMTEPLPSAGKIVLKYKKDSDSSFTKIFQNTTDNSIFHESLNIENLTAGGDTVTMTIASPAVVTLVGHGLVAGQTIKFATTGALPTGVSAGVVYYVISTGLTADTFRFSTTSGGSAVNTSGSQSGVHTMDRTVTLPQYRELTLRAESTGGAVISGIRLVYEEIDNNLI